MPSEAFQRTKAWIRQQNEAGRDPSISETATTLGVGTQTVRRARQALKAEGHVVVRPHTPSGKPGQSKKPDRADVYRQIVERAVAGEATPLNAEQRKALLSEWAKIAGPTVTGVQALEKLHKLESEAGADDRYRPPAPLTVDEAATRISRLMAAYGPDISALAWERAFSAPKEKTRVQEADITATA